MTMPDPAETETEARKNAGPVAFDRLVEAVLGLTTSNVQLVKTMRIAVLIGTGAVVVLMGWSVFTIYSMQSTLSEIRGMLQAIIHQLPRAGS